MPVDVIEALERTLADLRPAEGALPADPEALGLCLADLAWELALADTPRSHDLTAWAEALDGAHDLVRVRAKARRNRAYHARFSDDLESALTLASEAAKLAESLGEVRDWAAAEDTLANVHSTLGAFDLALAHSLTSIELNRKAGDRRGLAWSFENVARVHRHLGDLDEARRWIDQALEIFNETGHTVGRARSTSLLANILREMGDLGGAQAALEEAQPLWEESKLESGLRWGQIALARVLRDRGEHAAALDTVRGAIEGSAEHLARTGASERLSTDLLTAASTCEGALLLDLGRSHEAEETLIQALALASPERRLEDIIECHALLGELYEARDDPARALLHVKERLRLVDTRNSQEMIARARNMQLGMRVAAAEREAEVTERLLYGILPKTIVRELKLHGRAEPILHGAATVLFTDIVGFTKIAEACAPQELVAALDELFVAFDEVARAHGLEKVKTIGDAYMAVAGIPEPSPTHAIDAALAAIGLREVVLRFAADPAKPDWKVRIGIHSGPLIAGVIGRVKPIYDVWGDTVNVASRMESSGAPDQVNLSDATHRLISPYFETSPRGQVQAKNKGLIDMHFAHRLRPEYAADEAGLVPAPSLYEAATAGRVEA